MAKKRKGRLVNGIVIVDKPYDESSNKTLQRVKRLFNACKAGHTGSLDPMATGVLPICLGEATKFSQYMLNADKGYRSTFTLGEVTDTADAQGVVIGKTPAKHITRDDVEKALINFRGKIAQVPPMYCALKKEGQPLYKLARQGVEIERPARHVEIKRYELLDYRIGEKPDTIDIDVDVLCTKGTYVRSLAHDLGEKLGVGAHVSALRRTQAGLFTLSQAVTLQTLELMQEQNMVHAVQNGASIDRGGFIQASALDKYLLPMDLPLLDAPEVYIGERDIFDFAHGRLIMQPKPYPQAQEGGKVRVFTECGTFLGLAIIVKNQQGLMIQPKKVVVYV